MFKHFFKKVFVAIIFATSCFTVVAESPFSNNDETFLAKDPALFELHKNEASWTLKIFPQPGYYLYQKKLEVKSLDGLLIEVEELPKAEYLTFADGSREAVYSKEFDVNIKVNKEDAVNSVSFEVYYQSCREDGLCLAPASKIVSWSQEGSFIKQELNLKL